MRRVAILYNPVSGRGRAREMANGLQGALADAGFEPVTTPTEPASPDTWLDPVLADSDVAVVVGGDGAVRLVADAAARSGTPIWHHPAGTENLFAREFEMTDDPDALVDALRAGAVRAVDVAVANGRSFLLMATIGFDAEVVNDLAQHRGERIRPATYIRPILRQLRRWRPIVVGLEVDGAPIETPGPGWVVVANSRQYGWRLDPAWKARMDDGLLDVIWLPMRGRIELAGWAIACRTRWHTRSRRLVYTRGSSVRITTAGPCRFQLDGDPPPPLPDGQAGSDMTPLDITIQPGALGVLLPTHNR